MTLVVSGSSMSPALSGGDTVTIELGRKPERFDVVAYREFWDGDADQIVVGRVIGLPDEKIEVTGPKLTVDGLWLEDPFASTPANYVRKFDLTDDEYVVLEDRRDTGDDSHSRGPIPAGVLLGSAPPR